MTPPKDGSRGSLDGKRRRDSFEEAAAPSTDEPGSGGKRTKVNGGVSGRDVSNGDSTGGGVRDGKAVVGCALEVTAAGGTGKGKRSRDASAEEDESLDPGSGGKRPRKSTDWEGPNGASTSAPVVISGSVEDGEVEDGEIPIRAAVPVYGA